MWESGSLMELLYADKLGLYQGSVDEVLGK